MDSDSSIQLIVFNIKPSANIVLYILRKSCSKKNYKIFGDIWEKLRESRRLYPTKSPSTLASVPESLPRLLNDHYHIHVYVSRSRLSVFGSQHQPVCNIFLNRYSISFNPFLHFVLFISLRKWRSFSLQMLSLSWKRWYSIAWNLAYFRFSPILKRRLNRSKSSYP